MNETSYDIVISGGGAAGFFSAINIAENNPSLKILILEKSAKFLDKVRISGGGRCNVTHACWEPKELIKFYPRGQKELIGPFHRFMCGDMLAWLDEKGVETKIEDDGRVFPKSNTSTTIIECFVGQVEKLGIETRLSEGMKDFSKNNDKFNIITTNDIEIQSKSLIIATGGTKTIWNLINSKGIEIVEPVPSLFTFKINHPLIKDLPGLSLPKAGVRVAGFPMETTGPVLITHWGLSGPGILKLSSWAARFLYQQNYKFEVFINWINKSENETNELLQERRKNKGGRNVYEDNFLGIPKRLWRNMINQLKIKEKNWADLSKNSLTELHQLLCNCSFQANGKTTNKDEFVTSGGILLKEVNFKTMESKKIPHLYFAGEVLDIDALTGGFNFQAAWTTSWIIGQNSFE
ncbi:NAD(P)/FAD-dependent oxidoreductase [Saprospiraceae bacterium]|nr:NAD(P)/FAD-dependent oxidoreductase [Saprospiraceae bacterium]